MNMEIKSSWSEENIHLNELRTELRIFFYPNRGRHLLLAHEYMTGEHETLVTVFQFELACLCAVFFFIELKQLLLFFS